MGNFIFGLLFAGLLGVILYLYLKERTKLEVEKRRALLDALKKEIEQGGEDYKDRVELYNNYVTAHADILRKHGIDPTPIELKSFVKDVRNGRFIDTQTGAVVDANGGRLATVTPQPNTH